MTLLRVIGAIMHGMLSSPNTQAKCLRASLLKGVRACRLAMNVKMLRLIKDNLGHYSRQFHVRVG